MTKTTLDLITEVSGFGNGLLCLSEEIRKFERHPECTDYQRGLLRAAREAVWRIEVELLAASAGAPRAPEEAAE